MTWIDDTGFTVHYHPAIVVDDYGIESSVWPEKWPLEFLKSIEHTRDYLKNYANSPRGYSGGFWSVEDFKIGELEGATRTMLSIDPAVTTKSTSDYTGLAVVEWAPRKDGRGVCRVKAAVRVRLSGADLRWKILQMLEEHPSIGLLLIESNQGGEVWPAILHDMPVPLRTIHQTVKKEVRAAAVLNEYQTGHVLHAAGLVDLETEMVGFPRAPHDDLVDAVGTAVSKFLQRKQGVKRAGVRQVAYI